MVRKTVEPRARRTEKTPDMRRRWAVVTLSLLWLILTFSTLETAQVAAANRQRPTPSTPSTQSLPAFRSSALSGVNTPPSSPLPLLLLLVVVVMMVMGVVVVGNMKDGCTTRMSPRTGKNRLSELNVPSVQFLDKKIILNIT